MFQQLIFNKILTKHDNQAEALNAVSELLYLNKSNVYRRFSGDIALKPQEIELLAKHYEISLDELVYVASEQSLGYIVSGGNQDYSKNYILNMLQPLRKISKIPNFSYTHASTDFTWLYYGHYPKLYYFKTLQWKRLLWKVDGSFQFNFNELTQEEKDLLIEVQMCFECFKWVEFFDVNKLNLFLEQVIYTYEMGVMTLEDAQSILSVKLKFINDLEKRVALGTSCFNEVKPNYEAYFNPTPYSSSIGMAKSTTENYVTALFNPPHVLHSHDLKLIAKLERHFELLKNKSTKISGTGELTRRRLFAKYRKDIRRTEKLLIDQY